MEEILKMLFEQQLLSEETKTQLTEHAQKLQKELRESIEVEVRAELAEQFVAEKAGLAEKMNTFVTERLRDELDELREGLAAFRDLEAEYNTKLTEAQALMAAEVVSEKQRLQEQLEVELEELINEMDAFFELRLTAELTELKEDIQAAKNSKFGEALFEAFADTFMRSHLSKEGVFKELAEAKAKIDELSEQVQSVSSTNQQLVRESKMEELLSNLQGAKREQMQLILKGVTDVERLDETYAQFIGHVLKEDQQVVINEGADKVEIETTKTAVLKTGDGVVITEGVKPEQSGALSVKEQLQRLAGIK